MKDENGREYSDYDIDKLIEEYSNINRKPEPQHISQPPQERKKFVVHIDESLIDEPQKEQPKPQSGGIYFSNCDNCPSIALCNDNNCCGDVMIHRLGELEDKIESGELMEVPRGAVILTPEEREEEMKAAREERVEFERRIELLNDELNRELFEHKAFIEKTAIEVGRLKTEKAQAVKEFAEKLKERVLKFVWKCNIPKCIFKDIMTDLLKEYEEQLDEFADCKTCPAWSGSDCTRNPYIEGCLKEVTK